MKEIKLLYFVLCVFSLIMGLGIYILFRDLNNIVLFEYISIPVIFQKTLFPMKTSNMTNFIRFHLPDMLWFLSGILFFRFIWFEKIKIQAFYILCFYVVGIMLEISQLSNKIFGTFDFLDLLFMSIVALVDGLLYRNLILRRCL